VKLKEYQEASMQSGIKGEFNDSQEGPSIEDYIQQEDGMEDIRLSTTLFN